MVYHGTPWCTMVYHGVSVGATYPLSDPDEAKTPGILVLGLLRRADCYPDCPGNFSSGTQLKFMTVRICEKSFRPVAHLWDQGMTETSQGQGRTSIKAKFASDRSSMRAFNVTTYCMAPQN